MNKMEYIVRSVIINKDEQWAGEGMMDNKLEKKIKGTSGRRKTKQKRRGRDYQESSDMKNELHDNVIIRNQSARDPDITTDQ
jgi:hypothetical protein